MALWVMGASAELWWWLTNDSPPTIEASLPTGPVRGSTGTLVSVRAAGGAGSAQVTSALLDGAPLTSLPVGRDGAIDVDTGRLPDGRHVVRLEVADTSRRANRAVLELPFVSDNTAPTVAVDGLATPLRAGQPAALRLIPSEPAELRVDWDGQPLPIVGTSPGLALIAVAPTRASGAVQLAVSARDAAGNSSAERRDVSLEAVSLPRQNLLVPAALAALATGPGATRESEQLVALTATVRPERLWSGEFRAPLTGARTTGFGDRRDYADGYVASHGGYDIAAPERTPIAATAAGVAIFAGPLQQRGTAIVLDHGWGVASVYGHLSEIHVRVGDSVSQGQTIGLVGTTGLSTGPHLHWEIRLRGQPVDPDGWVALSRSLP
jgi:murein DD-endopeptidase MepM/ murein hydrolase activator NlpD